jgi:hypothetical protein
LPIFQSLYAATSRVLVLSDLVNLRFRRLLRKEDLHSREGTLNIGKSLSALCAWYRLSAAYRCTQNIRAPSCETSTG